MEIDLSRLNLADLNLMLSKAEKELQEKLLEGITWSQTKSMRDSIIDLRIAVYRLTNPHDSSDISQIRNKLNRSPSV